MDTREASRRAALSSHNYGKYQMGRYFMLQIKNKIMKVGRPPLSAKYLFIGYLKKITWIGEKNHKSSRYVINKELHRKTITAKYSSQ